MKKITFLLITLFIVFTYACSHSSDISYDNTSVYHTSSVSDNEFVSQEHISVPEEEKKQEISEESVIQNITVYPENVTAETALNIAGKTPMPIYITIRHTILNA